MVKPYFFGVLFTVIGILVVVLTYCSIPVPLDTKEEFEIQIHIITIWISALLVWVILYELIVGYDTIQETPLVLIGFVWPMILIGFDIFMISHQTYAHESKKMKQTMQLDSNAISGLAFAVAGVLSTNIGKDFAKAASPMLTAVTLICLAFVLPNPGVQVDSIAGIAITSIQKVCLTFCIGLLASALCINISATMGLKSGRINLLKKSIVES